MIRCVAIDDEPIALSIIREYCSRYDADMHLECFTSPVEGMEYIDRENPEIVFLDVEMNSYNGVELAKRLPPGTTLIFTTAYSQYALDGFNVNAVDFLHKPIFYPRFEQAMVKALAWIDRDGDVTRGRVAITLKAEHKNVVVALDTIVYIEAMDNYIKVFRRDLPTVVSQITMKEIEAMLPSSGFIRVHRSYIVPLDVIDRFSNRKIYIHSVGRPIPVGRTYNDSFIKLYNIFKTSNPTKQ